MPPFNEEPKDNQNLDNGATKPQLQPNDRFKPFSVPTEQMSAADQILGNEVGSFLQANEDKKLEDNFAEAVRFGAGDDDATRMERCNRFLKERYGIDSMNGNVINSGADFKMKPFDNPAAYEQTLLTLVEKGYKGIASQRYLDLLATEEIADDAERRQKQIALAGIPTTEMVDDTSKPMMATPGVVTYPQIERPRKDEDIANDLMSYKAQVYGENFMAVYENFRDQLSDEGRAIVEDVVKHGNITDQRNTYMDLVRRAYKNPELQKEQDLVDYLCQQAKATEYEVNSSAGRGLVKMWNQIFDTAGWKIGMGLHRMGIGFDAMDYAWTGSNATRLSRMNRDERDEYERLRAEGLDEKTAIEKVGPMMQTRYFRENYYYDALVRERRAVVALQNMDAKREWEHYGYWENAYIGAASTIPYMAVTAAPYGVGFAINVFGHMQDVEDQIIAEGGDPEKAAGARAIGAVAWAAIEKLELKGFGRSLSRLEKAVVWRHLWKGEMKLALGELGKAAPKGVANLLTNWASETGQEGIQGAVEAIEKDLGLDKQAAAVFKDALAAAWQDTKDSAGTMAIISAAFPVVGGAVRAPFQRRKGLDRESVLAYIEKQEQLKNMLQGAYQPEPETQEAMNRRIQKAYNEIQQTWDDAATPMEAVEMLQHQGYTADEAMKIAEYFDMRSAILREAAANPNEAEGLRDAMIAGNAFRIGADTTYNPADLFHLINANIVTEEIQVPTPGEANAAPQDALKVTVPMKDAAGNETTRSFTVITSNKTPDIETQSFAASVAQATRGTDAEITPEAYLAMDRDQKEAYLLANDLKQGGDFRVLDADGREIFSSDALVQLARANSAFVRKGGNWTLAHETAHAIVAFSRQMGLFDPDAETTKTMVKLFGAPRTAEEAWNEEAMADGFAEYLRGKFDFKGLTRDERTLVERVFDAVIDFFKTAYYRLTGKTPDPAAVEVKAREQAMDAVFEGIRTGDFSGLSAFAGIDFGEDSAQEAPAEAAPAAETAENGVQTPQQRAAQPTQPTTPPANGSATEASTTASASAEERVKKAHAAKNGVKVTQANPTQASLQAQMARIEAKLNALIADPKAAAANVPTTRKV